ncbi:D-alanyl-D-alanine carboxypeptidase [Agrobacterium sp. SHOUNA12C]|uniref:D-alanyl-D-alanine carboxypeptidase protein n=2 Tax=Rhizobium rhizogenes TaxID=359 RepID=B9JAN5_RHIR8|nr:MULTISPECIES: D-alanyl-D-alanine carboxypeptidase family protein [Rhizobium]ACM25718.1 D-alanyl-D-alanine carboxypeptidase protein [Rhizobium rhizogenes K84]KAA6483785.1 D-alanyl-D-alanine carboxypeptidase [Agrobacterium sp. ICMP 7243]MCJ9720917.1 D-alanyl-D-alanine carboxypeptidase [Agrobacterium sp. BETTINA12B]MCJ9758841.1 D-alanyl-D-alanine carboxypeptidase [Agrobacterium sp. SHOUNA12C]OCJ21308.1 peptidase M15 [Agrobacterium sp. B131/95]OCJ26524.1 peptidase M15 [Agrobacterium sp. B133/9
MKKFLMALSAAVVLLGAPVASFAGSAYFIMDAKTGAVLASSNADDLNHPASLTKMMTLYMTFEAINRGKLSWNSKIPVSSNAAGKPPTKLGLKPGGTVTVREAVDGMIIKSANDAAAAMAEALGGSESGFARLMTQKAREIGMRRTVFMNASGLPNMQQVTTARDMSTLAVALINNYPQEYRLFSQTGFTYRGQRVRGHNNLMYRYEGMDGIKTGYTNASGFNLVSAVRHGNRRVIGVVMGGATARGRDALMASLLDRYVPKAASSSTSRLVASIGGGKVKQVEVASASNDVAMEVDTQTTATTRKRTDTAPVSAPLAYAAVPNVTVPMDRPVAMDEILNAGKPATGRWQVQIAATPTAQAAKDLLSAAQSKAGNALANASPYTEAVGKGSGTVYRARFVGFGSRDDANSACAALKRNDFDCLLLPHKS